MLWIDADTTPDIFWQRLCTSLKVINATYAHELLMAGFPYTDEDIRKITYILDMFPSKESEYIIVIDNFKLAFCGKLYKEPAWHKLCICCKVCN